MKKLLNTAKRLANEVTVVLAMVKWIFYTPLKMWIVCLPAAIAGCIFVFIALWIGFNNLNEEG